MLSVNIGDVITATIMDEFLNIHNSDIILKDLKDAALSNSGKEFVLDFKNVLTIDSSAIAMLVSFVQFLAGSRRKMSIVNVKEGIKKSIKVLNLASFLNIK